jgi:hypothetical protein|nr:MAG TPA: hypothetical protein [Bacteriophage sp.]
MKKIELITTESEDISISQVISQGSEKEYYLVGNNKALVCNDSNYRMARLSELSNKLKLRDWNVTNRRFAFEDQSEGNLQICIDNYSSGSGIVNEINEDTKRIVIDKYELSDKEKSEFNNYLEYLKNNKNEYLKEIYNLYSSMNSSEIYLYSTSKNVVDILNDSITIDIIPYNSDIYTNTVDLTSLINYSISPGVSTKIDLGIQYSKNETRYEEDPETKELVVINEEKLYSKETTFAGPSFNQSGELVLKDYIEQVNSDVMIECIDNIIRVVSKSTNIDECIISNCTVTYGKL